MTPWENFYNEKIEKILTEHKNIIDIGGGLRIDGKRGNRVEKKNLWMLPLIKKINYKIMDPVSDYHPDIVGDIHNMPFGDNELDGIICNAVLEHIENPFKAVSEMYRVLKLGGACFVYVPFLYYYHAQPGYYKDYWRYTKDALKMLFKDFSVMEIQSVRGPFQTWIHLSPFWKYKLFSWLSQQVDILFKKKESAQVSGYFLYLEK
ncbi:MAG: class I SAM-dependent methyltransferase [Candidatus Pacebacteria bacterium]|nr:class I SAM-dependent methyltransferase [Candidatus Paceibacterota bacterium]